MLSSNDLNKFYDRSDFKNILKEKLPQKKFLKILNKSDYIEQIITLQSELVLLQNWIKENNKRVCIIFEGRDAAGKGGAIKRFVEHLNPRNSRVVALSKPTELELGQWYFQRYLRNLPNPGEIVFFDRSWYNRAIVEPVMGFCSNDEYLLFMNQVNDFEKMLIDDGIIIIKLWFSISKEVQKSRFVSRLTNPLKTWKFSNVDLEGQKRWDLYSEYKTKMFDKTNTDIVPWKIINSNNKLSARIESIKYVLSLFDLKNKNSTAKQNKLSLTKKDLIQIDKKQLKILNKSKSLINLLSRKNTSITKTLRYIKYEKEMDSKPEAYLTEGSVPEFVNVPWAWFIWRSSLKLKQSLGVMKYINDKKKIKKYLFDGMLIACFIFCFTLILCYFNILLSKGKNIYDYPYSKM